MEIGFAMIVPIKRLKEETLIIALKSISFFPRIAIDKLKNSLFSFLFISFKLKLRDIELEKISEKTNSTKMVQIQQKWSFLGWYLK